MEKDWLMRDFKGCELGEKGKAYADSELQSLDVLNSMDQTNWVALGYWKCLAKGWKKIDY